MERQPAAAATEYVDPQTAFTLDMSGLRLDADDLNALDGLPLDRAHEQMKKLEAGAVKNPDEHRAVTHFTDRLGYPQSELFQQVEAFASRMRAGDLQVSGGSVEFVVINGIGGSALGPQLLQFAINGPYWNELDRSRRNDFPRIYFLDNTDPAGLADLKEVVDLSRTLIVSISKSGGTQETRNNLIGLKQAFAEAGLDFRRHATAVTMADSQLDRTAAEENWIEVFHMAESIGGRTSETNVVGHLPAALAGIDFAAFVEGARHMDELTRRRELAQNPAYLLAASWYLLGNGRGDRNMVIVPYSDRLVLFGKYLQQLVMESLGKRLDLEGRPVYQGLTVYGNKGGTDAHAYIQQLNDGRDDFFITFIEVMQDTEKIPIDGRLQMGDYLHGFKSGLADALTQKGRRVADIRIDALTPHALGMLVALYERAVAVYAELIHINAYHQPGVQAYKLASKDVNALNLELQQWLESRASAGWSGTAQAAADEMGRPEKADGIRLHLAKFAVNRRCFGGRTLVREWHDDAWQYALRN